jgi:CO dehydrogenase maturation factor
MCGAHATVRGFLGELVARAPDSYDVIVDMEAGLEHLSRGTGKHVSRFLAVVEPYFRSMETARRIAQLAAELGIRDVQAVTNKIRTRADREAVGSFCAAHDLQVVAEVPYDETLSDAERAGRPPVDFNADAPAVIALRRLSEALIRENGKRSES